MAKRQLKLTKEQFNELRALIEELDLVPLSAIPKTLIPIIYEEANDLFVRNADKPFEPFHDEFVADFNIRLRERKKRSSVDYGFSLFHQNIENEIF